MTKRDRKTLQTYIDILADLMRLGHWTIILHEEVETGEGNIATVESGEHMDSAFIRVCEDFKEYTPEEIRNVMCHELIHLHLCRADDVWHSDVVKSGVCKGAAFTLAYETFGRLSEIAIHNLSKIMSVQLPLIKWN
jgi:hypothetical protein